jgi:hypothetical protein
MDNKLNFMRLITIGNNIIGLIAGIFAVLGLINLATGSAWGLGSRASRGNAIALSTGEEVFLAILIALIAGLYYLGLQKITDNNELNGLLYRVLSNAFLKFYAINAVGVTILVWMIHEYGSAVEIIVIGLLLAFFTVFHSIIISTAYKPDVVAKFVVMKTASSDIDTSESMLLKLRELREKGLITEEEYKKKREEVISGM